MLSLTHRSVKASLFALATVLAAGPAFAQDQTDADGRNEDLIIVTAQKREQSIKDVPITVSAISGEQMDKIGIDEFDELSAYIPGLNIQEQSANNPGTVSARDIRSGQDDLNGIDQLAVRGSLRIWPTDSSTMDFVFNYEQQRNPGTAFISGTLPRSGGDTDPFRVGEVGGAPRALSEAILGLPELGLKREVYDANVTFETAMSDNWTLTAIGGYRKFDSLEVFDADAYAEALVGGTALGDRH